MSQPSSVAATETVEIDPAEHDPLLAGFPGTPEGKLLFWIAVLFSIFQVVTAAHLIDMSSQVQRGFHLGFLTLLGIPLVMALRQASLPMKAIGWLLGIGGMIVAGYQYIEYVPLMLRAGAPNTPDLIIGVLTLVVTFVGAWLIMGPALPIITGVFLAYAFLGQHVPGMLQTRGYDFSQVIEQMSFGVEGIFGIPIYVSATYIFLFILFGSFLEKAGMIKLFTDVSLGLVGHHTGGAAKVAVVSSGFMGTISGSGVANVVTTGQFTIPMMKRFGYKSAFAGGVEATSSMGGQIMPPVMGAVAFIMAETLNIPYVEVVKAALIPAILYFASAFWMVHLEAGRQGLRGMSEDEMPSAMKALKEGWYLVLPLAVLVYLLFAGFTPLYAGTIGLALTMLLILGASAVLGLPAGVLRVIFWVGLGLGAAGMIQYDTTWLWYLIAAMLVINLAVKGGPATIRQVIESLSEGAKTALPVGIACALVGVIIGTMTLTGAANTFGIFIVSIGKSSLFLSLILTMITCLILGMGIPTIPNYIITSSIAAPALLELGVPLIVSHMFVFYFGILADLTPPVALACFAAAPIARESGLRISVQAIKIAAAGFVIPYMAIYSPELMLQADNVTGGTGAFVVAVVYVLVKAVLAIGLWGGSVIGWAGQPLPLWMRAVGVVAAVNLLAAYTVSDVIGFALGIGLIAMIILRNRRIAVSAGA